VEIAAAGIVPSPLATAGIVPLLNFALSPPAVVSLS
jgi:hypothetical protein